MRNLWIIAAVLAGLLAGCGAEDRPPDGSGAAAADTRKRLNRATDPRQADFPAVRGRSLQEVADEINATGTQVGLATTVFRADAHARVAFGVIGEGNSFIYGPTAVYAARGPNREAIGPFPAPADLLVTEPPYRSRQAASEADPFAAVYQAYLDLERPGDWNLLVVTKVGDQLVAAPSAIKVVRPSRDEVPGVGDAAPRVDTDTAADAPGNAAAIDTRLPPDDMHRVSFRDVVGKKPTVLLFATPQLCQSQVCGPVVDIALQLKQEYGDRVEFIHQEVYVDNDPNKGLRPPLRAFGLPTEPWLFAVDRRGRIAQRLEGSFGLRAMQGAVEAALRE